MKVQNRLIQEDFEQFSNPDFVTSVGVEVKFLYKSSYLIPTLHCLKIHVISRKHNNYKKIHCDLALLNQLCCRKFVVMFCW